MNIDAVAIPYELPEADNHSFFFIDQRVETRLEAKLHRHDAWELYCVLQGRGTRMAGDTTQLFMGGMSCSFLLICITTGITTRYRSMPTGVSAT